MSRKLAAICVVTAMLPGLAEADDRMPPALMESLVTDDHKAATLILYCPNKDGLEARISLDDPRPNAGEAFSIVFNMPDGEDDIPGFSITGLDGKTSLVVAYNGSALELMSDLERLSPAAQAQIIFERPAWILQFSLQGAINGLSKRYSEFCAGAAGK